MAPLVVLVLKLRRFGRAALPLLSAVALGALVVASTTNPLPLWLEAPAAALLFGLLAARVSKRAKAIEGTLLLDLEVGALLVVLVYAIVTRTDGALDGRLYPLVYVCVGLVSAFARPLSTVGVLCFALGLDAGLRHFAMLSSSLGRLAYAGAFMGVFASFNVASLRAEIARVRERAKRAHQGRGGQTPRRRAQLPAARRPATARARRRRPADEERLARSSVEEIHQSVLFALRSCASRWTCTRPCCSGRTTPARTCASASSLATRPNVSEGPFLAGDGVFGAAIAQRAAVTLSGLKPGYKLPYYAGPCPVRAVLALPGDRARHRPRRARRRSRRRPRRSRPREEELVDGGARYAVRAIQNERVFVQLERAKVEQGKLYRAAEALGAATHRGRRRRGGRAERARDRERRLRRRHALRRGQQDARGPRRQRRRRERAWSGQRFRHNAGLVSMVVENRHPLPYRGEYDAQHQVVFTKPRRAARACRRSSCCRCSCTSARSARSCSARAAAAPSATRCAARSRCSRATWPCRSSNARMVKQLEELATTDGLTGLLNKRAMLEVADAEDRRREPLRSAAQRARRPTSTHFKKVNDTLRPRRRRRGDQGPRRHPPPREAHDRRRRALRRRGVRRSSARRPTREGAMLLAERIREELGKTIFHRRRSGRMDSP